ncbi:uncharacterized protein BROUX77_003675 [Berkeleyomyces rouxiae]|uniref:uncharacterized protein n=1 Tax=Berkeleyomyces rouxiae TaxID=2035830 RepID=UPI003B829DB1
MPSELKTAILEDDNLNLPELNNDCSQATHFSRLGLPSDEAMDEYEHMRTSTVPSDGLANNSLRNGMHGFILSNEDSEKLISSSPPVRNSDANGYGELPPHPSSMQDELLDDVLPSSIFPTDDTDSQRTRLARHSSKEISVITRKTNNPIATPTAWREVRDDDMSVFMLSSESGFDEGDKKPPRYTKFIQ